MSRCFVPGYPQSLPLLPIPTSRCPNAGCTIFAGKIAWTLQNVGFPGGEAVKNLPANVGDTRDAALIPGMGRSPGEGNDNPFQYSCLGDPMDRGAWWAIVHRVTKSPTLQSDQAHVLQSLMLFMIFYKEMGTSIDRINCGHDPGAKVRKEQISLTSSVDLGKKWKKLDLPLARISFLYLRIGHRNTTRFTVWLSD